MVDKRIVDYIKTELARGVPLEQIKWSLRASGWPEDVVNEAINLASAPKKFGIKNKKIILYAVILVAAGLGAVVALPMFLTGSACGNGIVDEGETPETCCLDAGCVGDQTCQDNLCIEPVCGDCQYLDTVSHVCRDYVCCSHSDCDDNDPDTVDECLNPGTDSASCSNVPIDECSTSADCDDLNSCTVDTCSGTPKECVYTNITECISGDNCCPSGCNYSVDTDCPQEDECSTNLDCDDGDNCTLDVCSGTPKTCSYTNVTVCVSGDDCCPSGCDYSVDTDCEAPNCTLETALSMVELLEGATGSVSVSGFQGDASDVSWVSENTTVATVGSVGGSSNNVTANNTGTTHVIATDNSVGADCNVSITVRVVTAL